MLYCPLCVYCILFHSVTIIHSFCFATMNEEDIWVMDGIRRDVDRDIKEMLADSDKGASIVEWWDILWFENDLTVTEIRKMRSLDKDGVHLNARANKCAAASLCDRFRVRMARWRSMTGQKKRKMD